MTGFYEGISGSLDPIPHNLADHIDVTTNTLPDGAMLRYNLEDNTWYSMPSVPPISVGVVADLLVNTSLVVGDVVETTGYYTAGDAGSNLYRIVAAATGVADGGSYIDLSSGLQAQGLFRNGYYNVCQWGVKADGTTDNSVMLAKAMTYMGTLPAPTLHFPAGEIGVTSTFNVGDGTSTNISTIHQGLLLKGSGSRGHGANTRTSLLPDPTQLKWIGSATSDPVVSINGPIAIGWDGISVNGGNLADEGMIAYHPQKCEFVNSDFQYFVSRGVWLTAYHNATNGGTLISGGASSNIMRNCNINAWHSGTTLPKVCIQLGADTVEDPATNFNHDINQTLLENCQILANAHPDSKGLVLRFCDASGIIKTFCFAPEINGGVGPQPRALSIHTPDVVVDISRVFPANISIHNSTISNEEVRNNTAGDGWLGGQGGGGGIQYTGYSFERVGTDDFLPDIKGFAGFSGRMAYFGNNQVPVENIHCDHSTVRDNEQVYWSPAVLYREIFHTPQVTNSATETDLEGYEFQLNAGLLRTYNTTFMAVENWWDRVLKVELDGDVKNTTGSNQEVTVRMYIGGAIMHTFTIDLTSQAFYRPFQMDYKIYCVNNNPAMQKIKSLWKIGDGTTNNPTPVPLDYIDTTDTAFDPTVDNDIKFTVQLESADPSLTIAFTRLQLTLC